MVELCIIGFVIAKTENRNMSSNQRWVKWIMVELCGK